MPIEARLYPKRILAAALALVAAVSVVSFGLAADQHPTGNSAKGFRAPLSYFPAPNDLRMQAFLEGSESEMGPEGIIILHNAILQTFREDGSPDMTMKAPQCFYDYNKKVVNSSGAMQLETWDEAHTKALHVQGTNGFYWQQTNSLLIVSNEQATTISGPLTNSFKP
jgi:hypothetical protein